MNINDLSDLAYVLEQAKTVLNTGSNTRYPKEKIHELKRRVTALEGRFVDEVLELDLDSLGEKEEDEPVLDVAALAKRVKPPVITSASPEVTRKFNTVNKAVKNQSGAVVVEAPEELPEEVNPEHAAVSALLKGHFEHMAAEEVEQMVSEDAAAIKSAKKNAKTQMKSSDEDMDEFRRKLAAEKKKLASKKKKADSE